MENYELTAKNLTVVFDNEFNSQVIENLTASEHDLLLTIIGKLKEKGDEEVKISFDEIRVLFDKEYLYPGQILNLIDSFWKKVKAVDYQLYSTHTELSHEESKNAGGVMLFSYLTASEREQLIKVKINPDLKYFVNEFENGNYTSLLLADFTSTKDKYGKLLFRLLSQWSSVGRYKVSKEELEILLDVAESYKGNTRLFNDKVLNVAIKHVKPKFENLKVKKLKTGRFITHYEFTFTPKTKAKPFNPNFKKQRKDVTPKQSKTKVEKGNHEMTEQEMIEFLENKF